MNHRVLASVQRAPGFVRSLAAKILRRKFGAAYAFDAERFRDKRVLVLGPARTLDDDLSGIDIARFDVIVKMNNGLDTPIPALGADALRCDVLFHSLTDETRPVTPQGLLDAGVGVLVHRTPTKTAFLRTLMAAREYATCLEVKHVPCEVYLKLTGELEGACPTTGLVCSCFFLRAPVCEVAIMGFTFFSTSYVGGYDDAVCSDAVARQRIRDRGHHDPEREITLFRQEVAHARSSGVTVTLGRNVEHALEKAAQG
ncbi:hypothetical protein [Paracoccus aestuariivivens]|uniref:Uncharacterized protein n=1 Tax=Paracoccus aestuariivivens TaxID=1820333 RepID=A0A6L6J7W6_9RHOB|nr:hypothetical protein [Paracoccus aestuariivivens]MTH78213.1 hypothetical protein [Paracoccus aestuariivivens]